MDAPVRISPPSGVPSEPVAEIRCSQMFRKRAARALSFFSSMDPCPPRAIADADIRLMSGSETCESGRAITVSMRTKVRVSKGIFNTR